MDEKSQLRLAKSVAGVFLERHKGYLLICRAYPREDGEWHLVPIVDETFPWDASSSQSAMEGLKKIADVLVKHRDEISGVAVASYGPFVSLTPGEDYGKVHSDTADLPLSGFDLHDVFFSALGADWFDANETSLIIETDASACAVGEAYFRGIKKDEVLAYVFATEGVGIGLAKGRTVFPSALHPEVGLLPAIPHDADPIAKPKSDVSRIKRRVPLNFQSISELARNDTIRQRYNAMKSKGDENFKFSNSSIKDQFWEIRASYLAEVCVACIVVSAPHKIVIGADIDCEENDVHMRTWDFVEPFITGRIQALHPEVNHARDPVINYAELEKGLIDLPSRAFGSEGPLPPMTTGAVGLCYLAASASSEGPT